MEGARRHLVSLLNQNGLRSHRHPWVCENSGPIFPLPLKSGSIQLISNSAVGVVRHSGAKPIPALFGMQILPLGTRIRLKFPPTRNFVWIIKNW